MSHKKMNKNDVAFHIEDKKWLKFWYSPHCYIDNSWIEQNGFEELKGYRSSMVWQSCYHNVCSAFDLKTNVLQEVKGEWKTNLWKISQKPDKAITFASIAYNKVKGRLDKNGNISDLPLDEYRRLSQVGQGLALKQRFIIPDELHDSHQQGLWLLYVALLSDCPEVWSRMKLAFKSNILSTLPKLSTKYNVIDIKNLRRLWSVVASKL